MPPQAAAGRVLARPASTPAGEGEPEPGLMEMPLTNGGAGQLLVPEGYTPQRRWPLIVLLHGAGQEARHGLDLLRTLPEPPPAILFAPRSAQQTWDLLRHGYGPDLAAIDAGLAEVFARYAVDPAHVAIGGFSDGASYALSVGLTNGDLFRRVLAFSPGFVRPADLRGRPRIFISHGTRDPILPIERCSRRIVSALGRDGYSVEYREFEGGHAVPHDVARAAVEWALG